MDAAAAVPDPRARAARVEADAAASAAGIRIRPLDTLAGVRDAAALFCSVWRTDPSAPPLAAEVMRAVEHAGGYVVGAYAQERLVGASSGFLGLRDGAPVLHSHITGVTVPGRGIGLALKLHQRAWALARAVPAITWTFDPLVRRNAWFNVGKLGAVGVEYLVDFYGPMSDGVNAGESSDRLFTRWDLLTERPTPPTDRAAVVLAADGCRPAAPRPVPPGVDVLLVALPPDVETLRTTDPAGARAWRLAVREVLVPAFASGYLACGVTPDGSLVLGR